MKVLHHFKASGRILPGALMFLASLLTVTPAQSSTLVPAQSFIHFTCQVMGGPTRGKFNHFSAQVDLNPSKPASGHALIQVDPASIEVSSDEAEAEARGKNWFDVAHFPEIRFESKSIQSLGGQRYQVTGKMTVAGMAMDMTVPATLQSGAGVDVIKAQFGLKRSWFHLGKGAWADFDTVGDDVSVDVQLTLKK